MTLFCCGDACATRQVAQHIAQVARNRLGARVVTATIARLSEAGAALYGMIWGRRRYEHLDGLITLRRNHVPYVRFDHHAPFIGKEDSANTVTVHDQVIGQGGGHACQCGGNDAQLIFAERVNMVIT